MFTDLFTITRKWPYLEQGLRYQTKGEIVILSLDPCPSPAKTSVWTWQLLFITTAACLLWCQSKSHLGMSPMKWSQLFCNSTAIIWHFLLCSELSHASLQFTVTLPGFWMLLKALLWVGHDFFKLSIVKSKGFSLSFPARRRLEGSPTAHDQSTASATWDSPCEFDNTWCGPYPAPGITSTDHTLRCYGNLTLLDECLKAYFHFLQLDCTLRALP